MPYVLKIVDVPASSNKTANDHTEASGSNLDEDGESVRICPEDVEGA